MNDNIRLIDEQKVSIEDGLASGMTDILSCWKYTNRVDNERRLTLAAPGSFEELVHQACKDAQEINVRPKRGSDPELRDFLQPIFSLRFPILGDALFNGPYGLRAQYYLSPEKGREADATLVQALMPTLLAIDLRPSQELSPLDVPTSLLSPSTKLWINEAAQVTSNRDLDIERWVQAANRGVEKAQWGICAPRVTQFEVKGALIDRFGNERVPSSKRDRHLDIYKYGFS